MVQFSPVMAVTSASDADPHSSFFIGVSVLHVLFNMLLLILATDLKFQRYVPPAHYQALLQPLL